MWDLATAQSVVSNAALVVASWLTLEWVETRRTRAIRRRHSNRSLG